MYGFFNFSFSVVGFLVIAGFVLQSGGSMSRRSPRSSCSPFSPTSSASWRAASLSLWSSPYAARFALRSFRGSCCRADSCCFPPRCSRSYPWLRRVPRASSRGARRRSTHSPRWRRSCRGSPRGTLSKGTFVVCLPSASGRSFSSRLLGEGRGESVTRTPSPSASCTRRRARRGASAERGRERWKSPVRTARPVPGLRCGVVAFAIAASERARRGSGGGRGGDGGSARGAAL